MEELIKEIRNLNKLLVLLLTKGQNQTATIVTLNSAGFRPSEIANLLGAKLSTITGVLSKKKNKKSNSKQ